MLFFVFVFFDFSSFFFITPVTEPKCSSSIPPSFIDAFPNESASSSTDVFILLFSKNPHSEIHKGILHKYKTPIHLMVIQILHIELFLYQRGIFTSSILSCFSSALLLLLLSLPHLIHLYPHMIHSSIFLNFS